jgi:hypothetical protein
MIAPTTSKYFRLFAIALLAIVSAIAIPHITLAQDQPQDDPPGRVGRLNFIQGSVSYQVEGDTDWVQADPNRPLTTGDNLWVDEDSRGEVHIGSTAIRMSSQTGISFLTLDDRTAQIQLAQGMIEIHVRRLSPGDAFEIDTPNLAFTLARGGEYRISTDPDGGSTVITVREGEGEVTGGGQTWDLVSGQMYTFNGTDDISYDAGDAPGYDDFENWCQQRDQRENASLSAKYVSRDVDGYYDLDDYGDWRNDPDYGPVWVPRGVAEGWAPYQIGHWVYVAPWGWTWVDAEPWGFAPFHYGRWAFVGGYWGWVPGPVVVRPVYAPALVGFVGGGGFGVGVAFGGVAGVAWFPLGPRDVFVPAYRASPRYFTNINVTNTRVVKVTEVTNVYTNVYVNHVTVVNNYTYARNQVAVTAVSRDTFVNARPVVSARVNVSAEQIQNAHAVDARPIAPTRTSYVASTARVSNARPKVAFEQRPVVARLTPAVSRPAPQQPNRPGFQNFNNTSRVRQAPVGNAANGANNAPNGSNVDRNNNTPANNGNFNRGNNAPNGSNADRGANAPNGAANNNPPSGTNADRGASAPNGAVNNNANGQPKQPNSRDGYQRFTPPNGQNGAANGNTNNGNNSGSNNAARGNNNTTANPNQPNRANQTTQSDQRNSMRYAPPAKAKDQDYDVHPPLNQNQQNNQQQTRSEQKQDQRQERQQQKEEKKDDKDKDKDKDKK